MTSGLRISRDTAISAIYYALVQCGYEYASLARSEQHAQALASFAEKGCIPFFADVRQSTCEVYPYWPRAALLETASFHVEGGCAAFRDEAALHRKIMGMPNVADAERDECFWAWLAGFSAALDEVMQDDGFRHYCEWEDAWVNAQNDVYLEELRQIERCVEICADKYNSPVKQLQIVISPIKCVYSADYHMVEDTFIFCSGRLQAQSVIHEFLHHVVHPVVQAHQQLILRDERLYPDIDASYYAAGRLNAFEEHLVRMLTQRAMRDALPDDLPAFLRSQLQ